MYLERFRNWRFVFRKFAIFTATNFISLKLFNLCEHMDLHQACRNRPYFVPRGQNIDRSVVLDEEVQWSIPLPTYQPPVFTLQGLSKQPWADQELGTASFSPKWNDIDGGVNRKSNFCEYLIVNGFPLNPCGRTGLAGRGRLGRWGPNHAVDAVVTRWKRSNDGCIVRNSDSESGVLQFVSIQRRDTGEWALPGGMIDCGESADAAVRREFLEEALNTPKVAEFFTSETGKKLKDFFDQGQRIYEGYVDDPRNTDNAWMETVAFLFHDSEGYTVRLMDIKAGDDAAKAQWVDASSELRLYASHGKILKRVVSHLNAHW